MTALVTLLWVLWGYSLAFDTTGMAAGVTNLSSFVGGLGKALLAGTAMLVTQVATGAAALTWMLVEWIKHGKASVLGLVTGAVGGLVAITPASGSVGPLGAQLIGVVFTLVYSGILSYLILKFVDGVVGLRVSAEDEDRGLDISLNNEQVYYSEV